MNYEDRITKEYVENAVGDGLRLITGTYTGDGAVTRFIDLGVTPKMVGVWQNGTAQGADAFTFGGVAFPGQPSTGVTLTGTGFSVTCNRPIFTNYENHTYFYFALY